MVTGKNWIKKFNRYFRDNDCVVTDAGSSFFLTHKIEVRDGMRIITSGGFASMGFGIPGAIGAYFALKRRTICITGDGSFSQSIPELQTIVHYRLPIKIFVLNNGGYLSIRLTQNKYFKEHIGEGKENGLTLPSINKIANAYGIHYTRNLKRTLAHKGSVICEVMLSNEKL